MTIPAAIDQWIENKTAFQRVYTTILGTTEPTSASTIADQAHCSETTARDALQQLAEMRIVIRHDERPVTYRRNDSYLTWRRVESLTADHDPETLRQRLSELVEKDQSFQDQIGVSEPDAVSGDDMAIDDHDTAGNHWEALSEWRTVRRNIRVLRRAVDRVHTVDDEPTA